MGMGTSTAPGVVIQATVSSIPSQKQRRGSLFFLSFFYSRQAYTVYTLLICLQYFNNVATILLYALLCCIYAALFGVVLYFFPRLVSLLKPTLVRSRGLSARIFLCTALCLFVFGAHTVGYARLVVAPPRKVYWWWNYGVLELFPAIIFLVMMRPKNIKGTRDGEDTDSPGDLFANTKQPAGLKRTDSASGVRRGQESASLLKPTTNYGSLSGRPTEVPH